MLPNGMKVPMLWSHLSSYMLGFKKAFANKRGRERLSLRSSRSLYQQLQAVGFSLPKASKAAGITRPATKTLATAKSLRQLRL